MDLKMLICHNFRSTAWLARTAKQQSSKAGAGKECQAKVHAPLKAQALASRLLGVKNRSQTLAQPDHHSIHCLGDAHRLSDHHRRRRRLGDELEAAVLVDRDLDRHDGAALGLGLRVVRLAEVHDRDAVRAERGADGRGRRGLACGDLDLQIDDPSGTTLDTDVEDDDAPVLEFKTDADTVYYKLLVDMVTCKTDACFYGVGIFKTDAESPSDSSSDYTGVIDRQLAAIRQQVTEAANRDGREVTQMLEHRGMLTTGSEDVIALEDVKILERYVAVAVCDQDCDALDMQIDSRMVTDDAEVIAETTERTDFPMLEFVGRPFSEHSATVSMTECSSEPCFYGMVLYALSDE